MSRAHMTSISISTWTLPLSQTSDNPVYYIQYAHARIASVFVKLAERGLQVGRCGWAQGHLTC